MLTILAIMLAAGTIGAVLAAWEEEGASDRKSPRIRAQKNLKKNQKYS